MNNEEKILEMLTQMWDEQKQMRAEMGQMRAGLGQIQTEMGQMQTEMSQMQTEMGQMRAEMGQTRVEMGQMQTTLTRVALTQENIVLKSLDALAEGQDLTHQRLKDLAGKDELADLREEVRLLRTVVTQHSRDIEALKAAQ